MPHLSPAPTELSIAAHDTCAQRGTRTEALHDIALLKLFGSIIIIFFKHNYVHVSCCK